MTAGHPSAIRSWIEAMRLRTLPVSVAGVVFAAGLSVCTESVSVGALLLCLAFAVLAQVASNFANEYYDFRDGLDKAGRDGPRRGVTEGDITPPAMKRATFLTLGLACLVGCLTVWLYGSPWMFGAGVAIALGAMAYSTGPWPLSRHGLGEVAVVCFFGIAPVSLTYLLSGGTWSWYILAVSVAIGLMGANVLLVNNYRDREDDMTVGKRTLTVRIGLPATASLYVTNGFLAVILTIPAWISAVKWGWIAPCVYLVLHMCLYRMLVTRHGRQLNPLLGMTAMLMLLFSITFLIFALIGK
ncbi:MAG: 1,4-dihydroxy-2-naphthoate octaprenyltransferase [Muribaculaceae bacterium]|nr:1,4-dihydroxy-2-naphthoate octaprenyltransferase [Muribaculaceae bacterium]